MEILLGFIIRFACILIFSQVTNYDLQSWNIVGDATLQGKNIYPDIALLRHPYFPVALYVLAFGKWVATLGIQFEIVIKFIFVLFELGIIHILKTKNSKKTALIYALNPVSILITSIQGQFDSIPLFFLLLAYYLYQANSVLKSYSALSAAIAFKTWPFIFFLPIIFQTKKRSLILLSGLFSLVSLVIYISFFHVHIVDVIKPVLLYRGVYGVFGIGFLVDLITQSPTLQRLFSTVFLLALVGFVLLNRKRKIHDQITLTMLFFFVFSPTFGMQWLMWPIPFLLLSHRTYAIGYIISASIYLSLLYVQWFPIENKEQLVLVSTGVGLALWSYMFFILYRFWRSPSG